MATCKLCTNEYDGPSVPQIEWSQYCQQCKHCVICKEWIEDVEELKFALQYKESVKHFLCMVPGMKESIENTPQQISKKQLDYLNHLHLMFAPNMELSRETNIIEATYRAQAFLVDQAIPGKTIYLWLKRAEAITATFSIALRRDRRSIELELEADERKKYLAPRSRLDTHPGGQKPNKRETVKLSKRDKGIASIMKMGLNEADAIAVYEKAHGKTE